LPRPLTALSRRNVIKPGLQMGPDYPEVLQDYEIGGPEDTTDRRLVVDTATLEELLRIARQALSGRVVLHSVGLRVQLLRDRQSGHRWEHCTLIGRQPRPEVTLFDGGGS